MKFIDVNDDMIKASQLIKSYEYTDEDFQEYDRVYPYTTELIDGYMRDSQDKTVLSVVGSGDHYLDLVCKGATTIDSFDINRLSDNLESDYYNPNNNVVNNFNQNQVQYGFNQTNNNYTNGF